MSDDFDKDDDLSWLQDDDKQPEDDEKFDWQQGSKTGKPPKKEQSLGFTGELPWMQDDDSAPDAGKRPGHLGLTGELPWMQDSEPGNPRGEKSGLTGELPWMQDNAQAADNEDDLSWLSGGDEFVTYDEVDEQPISDEEALDWISADDSDFVEAAKSVPPAPEPELPEWLKGADTSELTSQEPAARMPEPETDDAPDWLKTTPPEPVPDPIMDVPDWLMGADDEIPEEENKFAPGGKLSEEWLAQGEALPETSDSSMTFDQWMANQAAAERIPDLDEQMPELGELTDDVVPTGKTTTGDLPDWFLGMEEIDTTNAPSWFTGEEPEPTTAAASEVDDLLPDWLTGTDQPVEAAPVGALDADDEFPEWISGAEDELPEEAEPALNTDFLSNLGLGDRPQTPAPMPNFNTGELQAMFGDDSEEDELPEPASAELGDDFFSSLEVDDQTSAPMPDFNTGELQAMFGGDDTDEDELPQPASAEFDDDFFSKLGIDDQTPTPMPNFNTGELQAMFGGDDTDEDELPEPISAEFDDDFLSKLGIDDETAMPKMTTGELAAMLDDDIDMDSLNAAFENSQKAPADQSIDDYIASLTVDEPAPESVDWFGETDEPEQATEMDWLDQLGDLRAEAGEAINEDDFGAALASAIEQPEPSALDNILASLETSGAELPDTDELMNQEVDFDSLLSDPAFSGIEAPRTQPQSQADILPSDGLDFLTELGASVSENSAAAIVRQRKDRPLDELPDRLRKLRDRGDEVIKPPPKGNTGPLSELLPGVSGTLVPSIIEVDSPGIVGTVTISPAQQAKIDLLKSLTAADESTPRATRMSAIDRTYDTPFLSDEDDFPDLEMTTTDKPADDAAPAVTAPRQRMRVKIDRLIISLLVAVGIILPFFVGATRIGSLPPGQFSAGSREQAVFDAMSALRQGQLVLFGVEYGPTAASELDTTTSVLLRHALAMGARPVIVSGNPVALLRANNMIDSLNQTDSPLFAAIGRLLLPNEDYFVTRYLVGNVIGLRALGGNLSSMLAADFRGQATDLKVRSLDDFAAVVVIAERAEDVRAWTEQISPLTNVPVLAAVGFSAAPLTEPYLGTGIDGLLVGYRDAFTYDKMLASGFVAPELPPAIDLTPTPEIEATAEVIIQGTAEATQEVIESTPEITLTETTQIGTIRSDTNANVRSGPGTDFATIGTVAPGDLVEILGTSADGEWANIRLTNGSEGWISSDFVRVSGVPEVQATAVPTEIEPTEAAPTAAPSNTPRPTNTSAPPTATETPVAATNTPRPTNTPAPSNTPAPTLTPSITPTTIPTVITARVIADTRINIRSGPGTSFQPVSAVDPGTELVVIGRNGDGSWIQVQLDDGREGWVSASLVEVSVAEADVPTVPDESGALIVVMADGDFGISGLLPRRLQQEEETPEATSEATEDAEATPEATLESTPELTDEPEATLEVAPIEVTEEVTPIAALETAQSIPYGEQRWYSMTLGLAVIIVVIALGALVNIARGLLRRK